MKVAFYHNLPPGGARRAAYELVKASSPDIEYDFFGVDLGPADRFLDDPQRVAQDVAALCRHTHFVTLPRGAHRRGVPLDVARAIDVVNVDRATRSLTAAIDTGGYDLVLAHHDQLLQAPPVLGRTTTPVVYFVQEPRRQTFEYNLSRRRSTRSVLPLVERRFDRWVAERDIERTRKAAALVVNSLHSLEYAYRAYGRYPYTCHLGVDEQLFRPEGDVVRRGVLAVGSLHPMKGHDLCIRELGTIPSPRRPPLTVVYERGTAVERARLERLARDCKVELTLCSGVPDGELVRLYRESTAVLCAGTVEPFGLTSVEALACGTPVVAVAEGGYREVVRDGENGVLVDRRPGRLGAAVDRVVRGQLVFDAARLRASVLPYFSWAASARRLDAILAAVAGGERMPA
ncbi:MAG: glycosyltransferase [Acidimicrobiia bacterium]